MKELFFISIFLIIYVYFAYPVLLMALSLFKSKKNDISGIEPLVSIIITAFNEEKHIREKITRSLSLDYPGEKLEIIVASDGSTDKTDSIVKEFEPKGVKLIRVEGRLGKTETQNQAVKIAAGEIIIFTDATTWYNKDVIGKLVRNFAGETVGCAGGELSYVNPEYKITGEGGGLYWKYERMLKSLESKVSSLIGVSGCLYALRKKLYSPIDSEQISDFVIAQQIVEKGYRVVYEPQAKSFELVSEKNKDEFKMRIRVALRSLHGIWHMRRMLNPFKHGLYTVQIISHKILRYAAPVLLIVLFLTNIFLLKDFFFLIFFLLQCLFYAAALFGFYFPQLAQRLKLYVPYYFCLVNFAALIALGKFITGKKQVTWEPIR